jgi:hypothetical protein
MFLTVFLTQGRHIHDTISDLAPHPNKSENLILHSIKIIMKRIIYQSAPARREEW